MLVYNKINSLDTFSTELYSIESSLRNAFYTNSVIYIQYNLIYVFVGGTVYLMWKQHILETVQTTATMCLARASSSWVRDGCGVGRECDGYQIRVGLQWCRYYLPPTFKNNYIGHYFPPHWRHCWEFPEKVNIWFWEIIFDAEKVMKNWWEIIDNVKKLLRNS